MVAPWLTEVFSWVIRPNMDVTQMATALCHSAALIKLNNVQNIVTVGI